MKYVLKQLSDEIKVTGIANLHFFEFPENYYTAKDSHPFFELIFVAGGRLSIKSLGFDGILEKNCLLIHGEDEVHSLNTVGQSTPTVIIIGFTCSGAKLEHFSRTPVKLDDAQVKKLAEIVKEGRNVFAPPYDVPKYDMKKKKHPTFGAEQMLKNLLEYFLISLIRKANDNLPKEEIIASDKLSAVEILEYIDENFMEKITLDELAFIFRTNRSTLCKVFKSLTGKTITEYISDKKLSIAKKEILQTDKTMTEIAERLNFESIHYFTRFFKKFTGVSPKEFRKQTDKR